MSWWGKVIGGTFGFMLGGPLGAVLGAALGHNLDKGLGELPDNVIGAGHANRERIQSAFFTTTFSIMGHVCKADGKVTEDEISLARQVMAQMELSHEQSRAAMGLFNEGKKASFPFTEALLQFRRECHQRTTLIRMFMEIQIAVAFADGVLHPSEQQLLLEMRDLLGIGHHEYEQLLSMFQAGQKHQQSRGMTPETAYGILGVSKQTPAKDIKRAYRRLLSQHHPDKLVSKGLPEEMMKIAATKTHEIKQAYECIRKEKEV